MTINPGNEYLLEGLIKSNLKMVELGNQTIIRKNNNGKDYLFAIAKNLYTPNLQSHVSIDLNGKDGAIKVNLSERIEKWNVKDFKENFDLVTNFGTSEHCSNQNNVFYNIDQMCKLGGEMIHSVPLHGYWPKHCRYRYKLGFFTNLAKHLNYTVKLEETKKRKNNLLLNAILIKNSINTYENFNFNFEIIGMTTSNKFHDNTDNSAESIFK
jgi:hypothetical protein